MVKNETIEFPKISFKKLKTVFYGFFLRNLRFFKNDSFFTIFKPLHLKDNTAKSRIRNIRINKKPEYRNLELRKIEKPLTIQTRVGHTVFYPIWPYGRIK